MKKIRLEVPLGEELNTTAYKHRRLYLKIEGNQTTAFYDKDCKRPILEEGPKVNFDIEMPDEIGLIAVAASCDGEVSEEIAAAWYALIQIINRFEGLKKALVITKDNIHEVTVSSQRCNNRVNCAKNVYACVRTSRTARRKKEGTGPALRGNLSPILFPSFSVT